MISMLYISTILSFSILPAEVTSAFFAYVLLACLNATKYAFVEIRTSRALSSEVATTDSLLGGSFRSRNVRALSSGELPLHAEAQPSKQNAPTFGPLSALDSVAEHDWAAEFMRVEGILPPDDENPVGARLDATFQAGAPTTRFSFTRKWYRLVHVLALPYLFFGLFYRGATLGISSVWLPSHLPFAQSPSAFHVSPHLLADCSAFNLGNDTAPFEVSFLAPACNALTSQVPWPTHSFLAEWFLGTEEIESALEPHFSSCLDRVYPSPSRLGAYRLYCSPHRLSTWLGPTFIEAICQLVTAVVSYLLKAQIFLFFVECIDIFLLRLKILRQFNLLTAEPLTSSRFDFLTATGTRRWLIVQNKVLNFYESRILALQASSSLQLLYAFCLAIWLIIQKTPIVNDFTMMALLDLVSTGVFVFIISQIAAQISHLRREQIDLLLWKKQAVTTVYVGKYDLLKNALIRESFDDILAVLKLADKPSRIFGLQIDASKWSDAAAGVAALSVGNIILRLFENQKSP